MGVACVVVSDSQVTVLIRIPFSLPNFLSHIALAHCSPRPGNDANRYFTDYSGTKECYGVCSGSCRCISCGSSCSNHGPIGTVQMFMRPVSL